MPKKRRIPISRLILFHLMMKNFLSIGLKRIARKNFNPSKNARISSLHFKEEDFVFNSDDQQDSRKRKREIIKLIKRRLKDNAYPSIFNNLHAYYTVLIKQPRSFRCRFMFFST